MGTGPTETVSISPKWLEEIKVAEADRYEAECEKVEAEFNAEKAAVDESVSQTELFNRIFDRLAALEKHVGLPEHYDK
jgi:hypothetical protein